MHIGMYQWIQGPEVLQSQLSARSRRALLRRRVSRDACIGQGGDTPLYRVQLSSSTGQDKVNGQLGIFSIVNGQATIFL